MGLHPDYPIVTERLLLRPITAADITALHAYQSLPDNVRYVPYEARSVEAVTELIESGRLTSAIDEPPGAISLGVELRESGVVVADVVLMWHSAEHRAGEVGYISNPAYAGNGYVTEAVRELLRLGFDGLGLHRIVARLDARNEPSAAVARRLGMRQEAHLRENEWFKGEWTDELVYAILEDEWRANQASA